MGRNNENLFNHLFVNLMTKPVKTIYNIFPAAIAQKTYRNNGQLMIKVGHDRLNRTLWVVRAYSRMSFDSHYHES